MFINFLKIFQVDKKPAGSNGADIMLESTPIFAINT
jgi:hypothetical protein